MNESLLASHMLERACGWLKMYVGPVLRHHHFQLAAAEWETVQTGVSSSELDVPEV